MKFAWKIFFVSFLILIIAFGTGGFLLVNSVFSTTLDNRVQAVCDSNNYVTISFFATDSNYKAMGYEKPYRKYVINNFIKQMTSNNTVNKVKIGGRETVGAFGDEEFVNLIEYNTCAGRIVVDGEKKYIQVVSRIMLCDNDYYIQTLTDITDIYNNRDAYCRTYQIILMCVALFASTVLVVFSRYLTRPLVRLSAAAQQIADGNFSKRAELSKTKEIYELSQGFNIMAQCVEDYIEELKKSAQSRDDFVADFTHELKTPLTSIIGYADMLRSYELDTKERRKCADSIYKEGKRLEALSANLMNIIVLKNNEVQLKPIKTDIIFTETVNAIEFLLKKYNITLKTSFESAQINVEPSLLKTMLYNIIDNACKASKAGQSVELAGICENGRYKFAVIDNGSGIPSSELEKIIRPFYMVDKSRSRKMGGAGLGLALCSEIAMLHGSELKIESELGIGTTVSFTVPIYEKDSA